MIAGLLASGSAMALLAAAHPFVTYPFSLQVLARRFAKPLQSTARVGSVAVCVCAYNEERVIGARVENLLALRARHPALDILVYVDAASDGTARVLEAYRDRIQLVVAPERQGKTQGMNTLVGMTDADIVVFSDANVMFAEDAIERLVAAFGDPAVGCACGHLVYVTGSADSSTAQSGSLYWRLEEHIKSLESATGSVMGADGSIFALRRALHRPPPRHLIDDMFISLAVLCAGYRIVRVADAVATEAAVTRPAEEFRRKIRISCQAFNVNRALWPDLMRIGVLDLYKYVSHKLLRWLTIYLLAASGMLGLAACAAMFGPVPALVLLGLGAVAALPVLRAQGGALGSLREIVAAFLATGIGVWRSLRGDTFQTWNPPASARQAGPATLRTRELGA